jgi:hypothetical protein
MRAFGSDTCRLVVRNDERDAVMAHSRVVQGRYGFFIAWFAGMTIVRRTKVAHDLDGFGEFLTIGGAQAGGGHRK